MATKKRTVSVRLDDDAKHAVDLAARLLRQSTGAFLGTAGEERAKQVITEWAVERYQDGDRSLSELAYETGLAVEEIVDAVGDQDKAAAIRMFLASCRTIAETQNNPAFFKLGQRAIKSLGFETVVEG